MSGVGIDLDVNFLSLLLHLLLKLLNIVWRYAAVLCAKKSEDRSVDLLQLPRIGGEMPVIDHGCRELRFGETLIGFVPSYLLDDMDALDGAGMDPTFTVERVNLPPHPARYRVLVRLDAAWPPGFEPFRAERFQPFCASAEDRSGAERAAAPSSDSFAISETGARRSRASRPAGPTPTHCPANTRSR